MRPNYREQDGCWNCEECTDMGVDEEVYTCFVTKEIDGETITVGPCAICDDWEGEG